MIDYYNQQNVLDFSYEGEDYSVTIIKVIVCPQCYLAIASRLRNMKDDYLIVDIGSKTTDVVYVRNGLPIESNLPSVYAELIHRMMREKIHSLELELAERGYSLEYINIIYVGGGALMASDHAGKYRSHTAYDCDMCANAKGYEFLAGQMLERR